jgi:hypothetical protein
LAVNKKHDLKYLLKQLESRWDGRRNPVLVRERDIYLLFPDGEEYLLTTYGDSDYGLRMESVLKTIFEMEKNLAPREEDGFFGGLKKYFSV